MICRNEVSPQIIEAIYPGLLIIKSWCTMHQVWVYAVNVPPDYIVDTATVAFSEPL